MVFGITSAMLTRALTMMAILFLITTSGYSPLAIPANLNAAAGVLGLFAVANFTGWQIWRRRDSLSPYKGLQMLIPVLGVTGIAAVFVLDRAGIYESIQVGSSVNAAETYAIFVGVVAVLMAILWWQNKQG